MAEPVMIEKLGLDRGASTRRWAWRLAKLSLAVAAVWFGVLPFVRGRMMPAGPPHLVTEGVTRGALEITVSATGTLAAKKSVDVGAEVSGRVLEVDADYNDRVTRGQVLALIDPAQLQAELQQAEAQLAAAEATTRQAAATATQNRTTATRTTNLADQKLVAEAQVDQARADAARAEAGVASARANATLARAAVDAARTRLRKAKITSPIDGVVIARLVQAGQTLTAGFQTPLVFKLAEDLAHMTLSVDVDEADIGRVREGEDATFTVDAYPDRVFHSKVISLRNDAKTSQNVVTYEAVLAVDNQTLELRPGMTATATIISRRVANAVLVPTAALRFALPANVPIALPPVPPGWKLVWPKPTSGPPRPIAVRVGGSDGTHTELLEGDLPVGTELVTELASAPAGLP